MPLKGLSGRVIVVTGGASGVGLATAQRLVGEGAQVALLDLNGEGVERAAGEIGREHAYPVQLDVGEEDQVVNAFASVREHFGRLDGLHNNAGILIPRKPIAEIAMADFDRVIRVNLRGAFLCLREMLRSAAAGATAAAIVNTASGTALRGAPGASAYSATKAALIALTRTAAIESAPDVRVNAVIPGPLQTPMTAAIAPEARARTAARLPLGRVGTAEEVAGLVSWLLSDEAAFVTGALYTIDGGETAA
jgi:NAD(P)-dependent dehydrogenase (short-subunit alcohol dehydrogenase family)